MNTLVKTWLSLGSGGWLPASVALLSIALGGCSKQPEQMPPHAGDASKSTVTPPRSVAQMASEQELAEIPPPPKAPVVSPQHLAPIIRLADGGQVAEVNLNDKHLPTIEVPPVNDEPLNPAPVLETPELRNEARRRAMLEMLRVRNEAHPTAQPANATSAPSNGK